MPIANAVVKGSYAYVYDEKGRQLCTVHIGSDPANLTGYTSGVVNVRKGDYIYSYDEKGRQTGTVHSPRRR